MDRPQRNSARLATPPPLSHLDMKTWKNKTWIRETVVRLHQGSISDLFLRVFCRLHAQPHKTYVRYSCSKTVLQCAIQRF